MQAQNDGTQLREARPQAADHELHAIAAGAAPPGDSPYPTTPNPRSPPYPTAQHKSAHDDNTLHTMALRSTARLGTAHCNTLQHSVTESVLLLAAASQTHTVLHVLTALPAVEAGSRQWHERVQLLGASRRPCPACATVEHVGGHKALPRLVLSSTWSQPLDKSPHSWLCQNHPHCVEGPPDGPRCWHPLAWASSPQQVSTLSHASRHAHSSESRCNKQP